MRVIIFMLFFLIGFTSNFFAQDLYSVTYGFENHLKDISESTLIVKGDQSVFKIFYKKSGWTYNNDGSKDTYILNDDLGVFMYSDGKYSYVRTPYRKSKGGTTYKYKEEGRLQWELTGNSKKIKEYTCQEALVTLNGRKFSVWFTPEIPINRGPLKLHGLPGLIVEVVEQNGFCKIYLLDLKKTNKDKELMDKTIEFFKENPVLEYDKYKKIVKKLALRVKIRVAKSKAEAIQSGELISLEYGLPNGDYYFVRSVIDIPKGTMEELSKIDL